MTYDTARRREWLAPIIAVIMLTIAVIMPLVGLAVVWGVTK